MVQCVRALAFTAAAFLNGPQYFTSKNAMEAAAASAFYNYRIPAASPWMEWIFPCKAAQLIDSILPRSRFLFKKAKTLMV